MEQLVLSLTSPSLERFADNIFKITWFPTRNLLLNFAKSAPDVPEVLIGTETPNFINHIRVVSEKLLEYALGYIIGIY